jgi:hypothetical protein
MNDTPTINLDDPVLYEADAEAVMDHVLHGKPLAPAIAERVHARAKRVTEEIYRKFGVLDVAVDLIRETRDGE